jgi:hypothetical protein
MISMAEHPSVSEHYTMRSENRSALTKGVASDIHEHTCIYRPELS